MKEGIWVLSVVGITSPHTHSDKRETIITIKWTTNGNETRAHVCSIRHILSKLFADGLILHLTIALFYS